jgi:hypothetical protein
VRLNHHRMGLATPAVYIPIAEPARALLGDRVRVRPGRDPAAPLPMSRYLTVNVMTHSGGMALMVLSRPFRPASAPVVTCAPT